MAYLIVLCLAALALAALTLTVAGESLFYRTATVRKLEELRLQMSYFVPKNVDGVRVLDTGQRRCEEVADLATPPDLQRRLKNQRFCLVWIGVFFVDTQLKKTVHELRVYSGLFLLLLTLGVLVDLRHIVEHGIAGIPDKVLTPHVIPVLELVMLLYLLVRYFSLRSMIYATYPHLRSRRKP